MVVMLSVCADSVSRYPLVIDLRRDTYICTGGINCTGGITRHSDSGSGGHRQHLDGGHCSRSTIAFDNCQQSTQGAIDVYLTYTSVVITWTAAGL